MNQIGLARGAALTGVIFLGEFVGSAHQFQVVAGAVGTHGAQQLPELGHREGGGRDLFAQRRHNGLYRGKRRCKQPLYRAVETWLATFSVDEWLSVPGIGELVELTLCQSRFSSVVLPA